MELPSVFNFENSGISLAKLEKLLICTQCSNYYCNPRRHSDCGNLLCSCSSDKTGICPHCGLQYSKTSTSADWHVNNVIEATKTVKSLITSKQFVSTDAKSSLVEKCTTGETSNSSHGTNAVIAHDICEQNKVRSGDFKIPNNKTSNQKNHEILNVKSYPKQSNAQDRYSRKSPRASLSNEAFLHDTKIKKCTELNVVTVNIKTIMKRNAKGETKLHSACVKGDAGKVEEFLNAGADPCTKDNAGWTPLHEAVSKGHLNIVKLLLEAGAMVNVPGGYNNTSLHDAVLGNHLEAARLLIDFGANPDARNIEGYTPRMMAQTKEMELILKDYDASKVVSRNIKHQHYQKDIVLFGFNLSARELNDLSAFAQHHKLKQFSSYSSDVTHIVTTSNRICRPTIDIMQGILKGKWIVDSEWLRSSLNSNRISDPREYEVIGTVKFPHSYAPQRSRENTEKMQPSIFNGCHFFFSGVDKVTIDDIKFTKSQLSSLIMSGDGLVLTREPNPEAIPAKECTVPYHAIDGVFAKCSHFIIYQPGRHEPLLKYNMPHVKSLPVSWLLDCIETFRLTDP